MFQEQLFCLKKNMKTCFVTSFFYILKINNMMFLYNIFLLVFTSFFIHKTLNVILYIFKRLRISLSSLIHVVKRLTFK